jgi:hypothetical protein
MFIHHFFFQLSLATDWNRLLDPVEGRCGWVADEDVCIPDELPLCVEFKKALQFLDESFDVRGFREICFEIRDEPVEVLSSRMLQVEFPDGRVELRPSISSRDLRRIAQTGGVREEDASGALMRLDAVTLKCRATAMATRKNCEGAGFCEWRPARVRSPGVASDDDGMCVADLHAVAESHVLIKYQAHCYDLKTRQTCLAQKPFTLGQIPSRSNPNFLLLASLAVLVVFLALLLLCPMPALPREIFRSKHKPAYFKK